MFYCNNCSDVVLHYVFLGGQVGVVLGAVGLVFAKGVGTLGVVTRDVVLGAGSPGSY